MTDLDDRCLNAFPKWLRSLNEDALELASAVDDGQASADMRRALASALNYLFKSLDLIPDGIEDLGLIDDAFVFRCAAVVAREAGDQSAVVQRLATDGDLVREFLGDDYVRLERFVTGLESAQVRGRTAAQIVEDAEVREQLVDDVKSWSASYDPPTFANDEKNLVKLRSFLGAKLPS